MRKLRDVCEAFQVLTQRTCRYSPNGFSGTHCLPGQNAGFTADDGSCFDPRLFANAGLTADDCVIANNNAAREPGLGRDSDMLPNLAIMANVNQVIELGSISDSRDPQCCPVYTRVRAQFHVIADFNRADLREFFVMIVR